MGKTIINTKKIRVSRPKGQHYAKVTTDIEGRRKVKFVPLKFLIICKNSLFGIFFMLLYPDHPYLLLRGVMKY